MWVGPSEKTPDYCRGMCPGMPSKMNGVHPLLGESRGASLLATPWLAQWASSLRKQSGDSCLTACSFNHPPAHLPLAPPSRVDGQAGLAHLHLEEEGLQAGGHTSSSWCTVWAVDLPSLSSSSSTIHNSSSAQEREGRATSSSSLT